jgi:hypothetical protein
MGILNKIFKKGKEGTRKGAQTAEGGDITNIQKQIDEFEKLSRSIKEFDNSPGMRAAQDFARKALEDLYGTEYKKGGTQTFCPKVKVNYNDLPTRREDEPVFMDIDMSDMELDDEPVFMDIDMSDMELDDEPDR